MTSPADPRLVSIPQHPDSTARNVRSSSQSIRNRRAAGPAGRVLASQHVPRLQLLRRPRSCRLVPRTGLPECGPVGRPGASRPGISRVCNVPRAHRSERPGRPRGSRTGASAAEGRSEARCHGEGCRTDGQASDGPLLDCSVWIIRSAQRPSHAASRPAPLAASGPPRSR
jgi:hypothetical protein